MTDFLKKITLLWVYLAGALVIFLSDHALAVPPDDDYCPTTGQPCLNYTLTSDLTTNDISIIAIDQNDYALSFPTITLNGHTLTVTNEFLVTDASMNQRMGFRIYGNPGELVITKDAKFQYTTFGDARTILELNKLDIFGKFIIDGVTDFFSSSTINNHTRINTLTLHPGASIEMLHNADFTGNEANIDLQPDRRSIPVQTLELYGLGGDASIPENTVTYVPHPTIDGQGMTIGSRLYVKELQVNLIDFGVFSSDSILFNYNSTYLNQSWENGREGLAPPNNGNNSTIDLSLRVVDEQGNPSVLKADQPIGSVFTIANKISNLVAANINVLDRQQRLFNRIFLLDAGPYLDLSLRTYLDESNGPNNLKLMGQWEGYNADKSIPLLEGLLVNAAALWNGADLLTESGISNALSLSDPRYGQRGIGLFMSMAGYDQRFATGLLKYFDYRGLSFVGGPTLNHDTPFGHLLLGGFLEGGRASYDSVNEFKIHDDEGKPIGRYSVLGNGDVDYLGVGLLARHDFTPGYYAEASIRAGRIGNEFSSPEMGPRVTYDANGRYLGIHAGAGLRLDYKPGFKIETYGKVYWTKIGGDDLITGDGYNVKFDDAYFLRTRLGLRYTVTLTEALGLNLGGAWDYNFGGDNHYGVIKGRVGSLETPIAPDAEPFFKGSSGLLEVGLAYKPFYERGLSIDLSSKAYLGHVEGGSGFLTLKYVFGGSESPFSNASSTVGSSADLAYGVITPNIPAPESLAVSSVSSVGASPGSLLETGNSEYPPRERNISSVNRATLRSEISTPPSDAVLLAQASATVSDADIPQITVYSDPEWKQLLSPGAVSVVTPDDYQGEQKSIGELLDIVPGLHVNKRGGSGQYTTVNVRGSTAAEVGIYIDGVLQNLGGDAAVDLSLYTAENVARIEVYRGYVPVRFLGAPIGGVINIVTKKPADPGTTLSAGVSGNGGFQANGLITAPLFQGSLMVSAARDQSDGDFKYKYLQGGDPVLPGNDPRREIVDRRRMNNSHRKTDLMAKWQTERLSLQATWKEMDRLYPSTTSPEFPNEYGLQDLDGDPWSINRRNHQRVLERDLMAGYRNDWGELNWGVQLDYKYQAKDFHWEDGQNQSTSPSPGLVWSTYDSDRWGITLDASYKLGERNMLEFRGGFIREKLEMDGDKWSHPQTGSYYSVNMGHNYTQTHVSLQLQDTVSLSDDFWLTFVARGNQVRGTDLDNTYIATSTGVIWPNAFPKGLANDSGKWNPTFGAALKKNVTDNLTFKTTAGTFVRYPNFYEMFGDGIYIKPAFWDMEHIPLPQPEKGEQWDFTLEWRGALPWIDAPGNISATYFNRRTKNMIGLFQTPAYVYYGNYGKARASGVELEGGLKFLYMDFAFSLTWLDSEVFDIAKLTQSNAGYSLWFSEGHNIMNSPQLETHLRWDFRVPGLPLTIFAEHHYTDQVPFASRSDTEMWIEDQLHTVNLGFRSELLRGLRLTAGVNDVFNKSSRQGFTSNDPKIAPSFGHRSVFFPKEGRLCFATMEYNF
ncbi:MAG: TonB-dependent receptor plug domain-containing protein [Deltaproteobacteria bacterium]|jgi:outer membrane receptor protein involved in Fe transport|nr:TonB-dependent receptor plug domain-containing protein [Deltaproteobacteria bacterium]